jgi:hypothetical protein
LVEYNYLLVGEKSMKHWIFALFLAVVLLSAAIVPALAQDKVVFERLQIDLWPEYDQPSMLVIYHIVLAGETSLPANLSLRIPARAGTPYNVAFQDVDGMLRILEYTTQADGDWVILNFVALSSVLQVEYYDPNLAVNGDQRSFDYTWPADVRVRNLTVNLQQPRTATAMTSSLSSSEPQIGSAGLQYYFANYGLVDAGQPLNINLSYIKSDNELSAVPVVPFQSTGSGAALPQKSVKDSSQNTILAVALTAGILLVVGGLFWYNWQRSQRQAAAAAQYRRHAPARRSAVNEVGFDENSQAVYCPQCGRRAAGGDAFCRSCGTRLR